MKQNRWLAVAALAAAGFFAWTGVARAGDVAPSAPSAPAAAAADAPKVDPATTDVAAAKTPSPIHSLMMWVGKQVAPNVECGCPGTPEGEKAWRSWFDGGSSVPLAGLRDAMVADGWTADRTVSFFKDMRAKMSAGGCDGGPCKDGPCCKEAKAAASPEGASADKAKDGCCKGEGSRTDGKSCCGGCKKGEAKTDAAKPESTPVVPADAPAKP